MKFSKILMVTLASLFAASTSFASATWDVAATASGNTLTLDIKLETSAALELIAIAGSVNDYDTSVVSVNAGASTVASTLLYEIVIPTVGSFNGITNLESGVADTSIQGPGPEDTFLSVLGTAGAGGDGTAEAAQFQIVYDIIGNGTTTLQVGTFADYADAFSGASDNNVNNKFVTITVSGTPENREVTITVPEPTSVAASLAGLASVFGVVAVRRRASKG